MRKIIFVIFLALLLLRISEANEVIYDDSADSREAQSIIREIYESLHYPHQCVLYGDCKNYTINEDSPKVRDIEVISLITSIKDIGDKGELNGIILGLGVNYSGFRFVQNYERVVTSIRRVTGATGADAYIKTTTITQLESPIRANGSGIGSGLIIGYQGFLKPFSEVVQLGVRVYGDINVALAHFKSNGVEYAPTMLRYGFNADLMVNFITVERILGLGLFAGVRIGGASYLGDDIDALDRRMQSLGNNAGAFPKGSFDFALNVGLRANVAQNNGIELIFAIPMYQTDFKSSNDSVVGDTTTTNRINGSFKEQWSVGVRYIWTFDI